MGFYFDKAATTMINEELLLEKDRRCQSKRLRATTTLWIFKINYDIFTPSRRVFFVAELESQLHLV